MSEEKDFIEEMHEESRLRFGRELSRDEFVDKFAQHGPEERIFHLKRIKRPDHLTARQAAERRPYEAAAHSVHDRLTKAGR